LKERILLLGHGSPLKEANKLEDIAAKLHEMIHPDCDEDCVKVAYMEFGVPNIEEAIEASIKSGAKKLILHPYFINSGVHVTKDIPEMIRAAQDKHPDVEFIYTEPLGNHDKLVQVAMERINAATQLKPVEIERRSFTTIESEAYLDDFNSQQQPIIKRVVHATADFDFVDNLRFNEGAIEVGLAAIVKGKDILTDVEMVRTGIDKKLLDRLGGKVVCGLEAAGENTSQKEGDVQQTRSERGIEKVLRENSNIGIIAIGNAPTALLKTIELLTNNESGIGGGNNEMPLVIGVPVGFVKAVESKEALAESRIPHITALGRKGGTPVAVAIVNALLRMEGMNEKS
jgi:precorrin-8X/cobalt-precorrin-8 methylmutase